MKVLVAVASRHGATQEVAYYIGKILKEHGLEVDVKNIDDDPTPASYDAVVLGSAVYSGSWLKPALLFVNKHQKELRNQPLWLFSSGPIDKIPPPDKAVKLDDILAKVKPRGHKVFAGKVDKSQLNFAQKAILFAVGAGEGDFRDWGMIRGWAESIANKLNKGEGV